MLAQKGVGELAAAARDKLASVPECVVIEGDFVGDTRLFRSLVGEHGAEILAFSGSLNTLDEADALAHRIGIMAAGQLRVLGSPQHLKSVHGGGYERGSPGAGSQG